MLVGTNNFLDFCIVIFNYTQKLFQLMSTEIAVSTLIEQLNWRYATKKMNGQAVSTEKIAQILEATRLAATSYGLQPFTVLVITNPELKAKIQPAAWGQTQVVDCSHLLVFCGWNKVTAQQIDTFVAQTTRERNLPEAALTDYKGFMSKSILGMDEATQRTWADKQIYIALGTALVAAAAAEVDSTPMEGFIPAQVDDILGLAAQGLHSTVMLPLGHRDAANDFLVAAKKVRRATDELFQFL